jgi:hypothetical protein
MRVGPDGTATRKVLAPGPVSDQKGGPLSGASTGKQLFPTSNIQTSGKGMLVTSKSFFQTKLAASVQLRVQTAQNIKRPRRSNHLRRREPTIEFSTWFIKKYYLLKKINI